MQRPATHTAGGVCSLVLTVLLLAASSHEAHATAVVLVADHRGTDNIGQDCWEDPSTGYECGEPFSHHWAPDPEFSDFVAPGQSSHVGPLQMDGSGAASAFSDVGWNEANSWFDVTFDVIEHTEVWLTGYGEVSTFWGGGEVAATLTGPGAAIVYQAIFSDWDLSYGDFDFTGILAPGRYNLRVGTDIYPLADAWWSFDFQISPASVPEPGTGLMMIAGLLAMTRRSRAAPRR
jgi:hypothetical protein